MRAAFAENFRSFWDHAHGSKKAEHKRIDGHELFDDPSCEYQYQFTVIHSTSQNNEENQVDARALRRPAAAKILQQGVARWILSIVVAVDI